MHKRISRLTGLLLLCLMAPAAARAQASDPKAREQQWNGYTLPSVEFTRYADPSRVLMFRVPAAWAQDGFFHFKGPHDSELTIMIEKVPDGVPLTSFANAVTQNLRGLPGGADALTVRPTEISSIEGREFMFNLVDVTGRMTRRLIWFTVSGPTAVSFVLIEPEENAAEIEPYFKAIIESVVVFQSDAHGKLFEDLRSKAIKTDQPVRIADVRAQVGTINRYDSEARRIAVASLAASFDSAPDSVIDLLIDRRPLVRAAAVEALGRSSNRALDGFLLLALADPSADVALRAARALATREELVKLLRDDSAGWQGLQLERVMRAVPMLDEKTRNQLLKEVAGEFKPAPPPRKLRPPPPAPKTRRPPAPPRSRTKGGVIGGVPVSPPPPGLPPSGTMKVDLLPPLVAVRGLNNDALVAWMLPNFDSLASVLSVDRLLNGGNTSVTMALSLALESRTRLPVGTLIKLLADEDPDVQRLAAQNLAVSAAAADIGRIEQFAGGMVTVSAGIPNSSTRSLKHELEIAAKKIRWREEFGSATNEARDQLINAAFADSDISDFAWTYIRDALEGPEIRVSRPLPARTPGTAPPEIKNRVSPLADNILPPAVTLYAAIPDAQAMVDKISDSFSSIQLDSARTQANLLVMLRSFEAYLARSFDADPKAGILESSGLKPHSPIVVARWTAAGAPRGLGAAQRKAVILRVADRDRFEHLIATYQQRIGGFDQVPEVVSAGARFLPMLPAIIPLIAEAIGEETRRSEPYARSHVVIGYESCMGYPVLVIERRKMGGATMKREPVYIAYVDDAAVLAPDLFSLRDCLLRLQQGGPTLATNDDFKRAVRSEGDVIYMSDPVAAFKRVDKEDKAGLQEQGALQLKKSSWESSFNISLKGREWLRPIPFKPSDLKAPSVLLPKSSVAYLIARLDFASAWRGFGREFFGEETAKQFEGVWALDFDSEVLPELGPESGAVLLGLPSLDSTGPGAPWALFLETRSDKLARAFEQRKLFKEYTAGIKAARVKMGTRDYWFAFWNGFLVIAGSESAVNQLDSGERLSSTRDFERAARNAPSGLIAFGGVGIEAATAAVKPAPNDPSLAHTMATFISLARAFHSHSLYVRLADDGLNAGMSVSLDREGRFSLSDLATLSKELQFAAAQVDAGGLPITGQKHIDRLSIKITSKAPGAIDRLKDDISSTGQVAEKQSDAELIVTIQPRRPSARQRIELPVKSAEFEPFLKTTGDIRVDSPEVMSKAREIAGDDRDAWSVARKLSDWTFKNLKWKRVDSADAARTLATLEADCLEFSELFVAMARSLGLPARIVTGLAHSDGSFGGHAWVEVWAGEWVELDPTWGTNFVDATHIRSASSELLAYGSLNLIGIEVMNASRAVPEFQKNPRALVETICREFNGDGGDGALSVALEPGILVNGLMGEGAWEGMTEAERNQIYAVHRTLLTDVAEEFAVPWKFGAGTRLLQVKVGDGLAEALIIRYGALTTVQLKRSGERWFVRDFEYQDINYRLIEETLRPTLLVLEAKRKGIAPPRIRHSVEARVLMARGQNPEQALGIVEKALAENPGSKPLRFLKALCLMDVEDDSASTRTQEALGLYTALTEEQPLFVPALWALASHYASASDEDSDRTAKLEKAIGLLRQYAHLVPGDPRPHESLATIHERRQDHASAEAAHRKVLALDPLDPANYEGLASLLVRQSRYKDALTVVDESKGRGVDREGTFASLFLTSYGEPEGALHAEGLAKTAPERLADNFQANLNLAAVRIKNGRPSEALALAKRAAELDPDSGDPHSTMAHAYRKLRHWRVALRSATEAIKRNSEDAEAHLHRACALAQLRRPAEAILALRKVVELDEDYFAEDFENEPDLKVLARLPAFKKLINELKQAEEEPEEKKDNER
jgi:tetratricopeptide (TPR) repeat protein